MLPSKWTSQTTGAITWKNKDFTFQANCSFPAPRHNFLPYFEIFITHIASNGTVAIVVGTTEITGNGILPGWKAGSYGYHADDGNAFVECGEPTKYGPTYSIGDVVGCGITLKKEVYFTKNGKNLGVVGITKHDKLFPIVGLDHASITTNFGEVAFKFNPFTNSAANAEKLAPQFMGLMEVTVSHILSYLNQSQLLKFGTTCKNNFKISKANHLWKPLVYKKWPTVSAEVPIPSYYEFCKKRVAKQQRSSQPNALIENCVKWEFKCPVTLDKLTRTIEPTIDHCAVCNKSVYLVRNMEQLREKVAGKMCVAIDFDGKVAKSRTEVRHFRGRMRVVN